MSFSILTVIHNFFLLGRLTKSEMEISAWPTNIEMTFLIHVAKCMQENNRDILQKTFLYKNAILILTHLMRTD